MSTTEEESSNSIQKQNDDRSPEHSSSHSHGKGKGRGRGKLEEKLSSRFAMDEIDAEDIARTVNESHSIECYPRNSGEEECSSGSSGGVECSSGKEFWFREEGDKITANEVEIDSLASFLIFYSTQMTIKRWQ